MAGATVKNTYDPYAKPKPPPVNPGPVQTGPSMQQVLDAGGTYNYSRNPEGPAAGGYVNPADSYSLPIGGGGSTGRTTTRSGSVSGSIQGLRSLSSGGQDTQTPQVTAPAREEYHPGNTAPIDTRDSQNAEFGAAKARAGSMGRASMDALKAELADSGMLGGGTEARGLVDRLAAATNPLSDLNVAQLHENVGLASHAQDLQNSNANTGFQGGIAQRSQDIGVATTNANMKMQAAKEKTDNQMQMLQQALAGLKLAY